MNFNKTNNLVGWMVCAIACAVYILTMEATGSFWDCGEFISSCFKLQIPHPPGSPLFIMMGRFFIVLFGDNPVTAARAVNFMSAMASGFTILFLFWSITHFARKIVEKPGQVLSNNQLFIIMGAGAVGALAYTFSDSFWFSAVEGEVYATSSFFTALVFWAILKWEQQADKPGADRWLIFIFFMMGLSIGVHLLNLLTIPAIVMVYYFKKYKFSLWGAFKAFLIGSIITGVVLKYVIQYTIKGAGWFDIQFVNSLGMPFFVGFSFFFVLLGFFVYWGIRFAVRRQYYFLKIGLWGFAFMMLGYSTYMTTMIRSNADPAIDMFNVDNPVSLVRYLGREQYGDWPIVYGPDYTDNPSRSEAGELYVKGKNKYEPAGKIYNQDWTGAPSAHLFPRMWSNTNDRNEIDFYKQYGGVNDGDQPTMADNFRYFMKYQVGWMYFRYFMWNFAGKQNDLQGFGNVRDSNWISGIPIIDNAMYHNQSKLPASVHDQNLSYNKLYMLPLLLGLAGLLLQYRKNRKDFIVNLILFFFTGLGIVIYINQAGAQPRERDYSYVGSFYAFAIWMGLGVILVNSLLQKWIKAPLVNYISTGICLLAVPVLMAGQEWDDHNRSHKTLARDLAKDYLESCPPNAILISSEDNDTYPLWYAQEVEGIRPDVRIAITTLLGSDWYMDQLRYKINESGPADIIFTPEQIAGYRREVILFANNLPGYDQNNYYDLYSTLKNVTASDDPRFTTQTEDGETYNLLPTKKFSMPVDLKKVQANGTVKPSDHPVNELQIDLPKGNYILKNDLTILSLIAANKWDRPICFTNENEAAQLGLGKYLRSNGLAYRLVPLENNKFDNEVAYKNVMEKFSFGNANRPGVYFDEENRHRMNVIKLANAELAISLAEAGEKEKARRILENFDQKVRESNIPYGMTSSRANQHDAISTQFLSACYLADDLPLAKKVSASLKKDLREQLSYYKSLGEADMTDEQLANTAYLLLQGKANNLADDQVAFASDIVSSYQLLRQLEIWEKSSTSSPHISEKN